MKASNDSTREYVTNICYSFLQKNHDILCRGFEDGGGTQGVNPLIYYQ